jgi:hypothetical protein
MTTYLIAGFLLLGPIAMVTLFVAIMQSEDGCEDESGFHQVAPTQAAGPASQAGGPAIPWDHVEGAYAYWI